MERNANRLINKDSINMNWNRSHNKTTMHENENFFDIAKREIFLNSNVFGKNVQTDINKENFCRHILPLRDIICSFCCALLWIDEKAAGTNQKPFFSICCAKGKVILPKNEPLPILMLKLLENPQFMSKIRLYNASFSFLSFNATTDVNLSKNNVYTMRIVGMIHHRIGPLLPSLDSRDPTPKCEQIYFHDGNEEQQCKLRQKYSNSLNATIIIQIQSMLLYDCQNPYVIKFKYAKNLLKKNPSLDLNIIIVSNKKVDKRVYNKPSSNEIAVIIPSLDDEDASTHREAIVFEKNGTLKFIDANKESYDALQYTLMFPHGQLGWQHISIKLKLTEKISKRNEPESSMNFLENILHENAQVNIPSVEVIEELTDAQ